MKIKITLKNYRCFSDSNPARFSLQKGFTSFIGVNNSGKSSLLKFFYEFRNLFGHLSHIGTLGSAPQTRTYFNLASSIKDPEEVFCNANNRDLTIRIDFMVTAHTRERDAIPIPNRIDITIPRGASDLHAERVELYLADGQLDTEQRLEVRDKILYVGDDQKADLTDIGQVFGDLAKAFYIGPFRNALNVASGKDYFDIKVGQDFIKSWRDFKTGNIKRHNETAIRLTKDIENIFGFDNLEINPSADDETIQVFINGESYKLQELGSGITQFFLVLANAATKQPSYILIDEPELNLHPSLQLDFLTTLGSYAREGIVFATHSIGLARASADRIYSVRMNNEGESEVTEFETTPRLSELLGELSFSGYRELGFDKILLVEGTTDVKTIQQFLRLYRKDHQIVLLPLGGGSLINGSSEMELGEIKRISENVCALIDSERASLDAQIGSDREEFVETCKKVGITCHVLDRRATENYFTDEAVKNTKGSEYRALEPYQLLKESSRGWSKAENWRIARAMTLEDLNETDLGKFLNSL
jgi:ABC-type Mn2+/Zn2+ transport system ATPase subunit